MKLRPVPPRVPTHLVQTVRARQEMNPLLVAARILGVLDTPDRILAHHEAPASVTLVVTLNDCDYEQLPGLSHRLERLAGLEAQR